MAKDRVVKERHFIVRSMALEDQKQGLFER